MTYVVDYLVFQSYRQKSIAKFLNKMKVMKFMFVDTCWVYKNLRF